MRPFISLKQEEIGDRKDNAKVLENSIISKLSDYMRSYRPQASGLTKSTLMGPVGKLISAVASGKFDNEDAIVGFIVSVHNNTSKTRIEDKDLKLLRSAIYELKELHKITPRRYWLRTLREIDYGVFVHRYGQAVTENN